MGAQAPSGPYSSGEPAHTWPGNPGNVGGPSMGNAGLDQLFGPGGPLGMMQAASMMPGFDSSASGGTTNFQTFTFQQPMGSVPAGPGAPAAGAGGQPNPMAMFLQQLGPLMGTAVDQAFAQAHQQQQQPQQQWQQVHQPPPQMQAHPQPNQQHQQQQTNNPTHQQTPEPRQTQPQHTPQQPQAANQQMPLL